MDTVAMDDALVCDGQKQEVKVLGPGRHAWDAAAGLPACGGDLSGFGVRAVVVFVDDASSRDARVSKTFCFPRHEGCLLMPIRIKRILP